MNGGVCEARSIDVWAASDEVTPPYNLRLEKWMIYKEEQDGWLPVLNKLSLITREEDAMWMSGHAALNNVLAGKSFVLESITLENIRPTPRRVGNGTLSCDNFSS